MANSWKRIVHPIVTVTDAAITGSIYKVCTNGSPVTIVSASFGFQNQGVHQLDPGSPVEGLQFNLSSSLGNECVEADFSYVSASLGALVYIKTNGGGGWDSNGS
jgi:hypothetical protein|tara:strand:+ start:96 stop:407 length:312 start_codon:yes stop_codon:yes gene_type:complete